MGLLSRMGRAATELSKYYYPFTWRNKPSIESPINEVHLNHIEDGINEMDNRILILAQDKADATDIANVFVDFAMDDTTGVMTFTRFDGSKVEHDSAVEKIALNCYLEDDNFVLELADGTKQKVSLSKFIDTYEFSSTDTIRITVNGKNISAEIPDGKITLAKLEPTIMSTIRQYTLDAQTAQGVSEQAAGTAQGWAIGGTGFEDNNAKHYASRSQRYAVGGVEEGDTEDNAKYYCQQAQAAAEQATEVAGFDGTASTVSAIDTQGVAVRKASGTGHVTMTDAADHPLLNLDIAGKSEQMVTTGAQLLDLVDMTDISAGGAAISVDSGAYTISGTGTLTGAFSASYRLDYLKSQLKPGNLTLRSDLTIPKMYVRIWDGNTVFAEMQGNSTKQITQDMIDNENVRVECFFHGNAGSTITPGTYHPMLYQSGNGTWEPYTGGKPSPSPEYPQPIISTGTVTPSPDYPQTMDVTVTGAQLIDASKIPDRSSGGITVTNTSAGSIISGEGPITTKFDLRTILTHEETMGLLGNERTFTLSSDTVVYPYFFFNFYDKNGGVMNLQLSGTNQVTKTLPDVADIDTLYVQYGYFGNKDVSIVAGNQKVMLNTGPTALPWQPYQSGTASITLTEPLHGVGDYRDRIMCKDGEWGIERYISHYKLTSDIVSASSGGVTTTNNIIDNRYTVITCEAWKNTLKKELYENGKKTIGFCTIAPPGMINDWNTSKNGKENVYTINAAGAMYISIPISSLGITANATRGEVTAAVKQYVADNDVYVMFVLDTPTWEPLPAAAQSALNALTTYTGTTHVTVTAGGPEPDVGLEYFGQPGDKVTVQDMCDSLAAPGFDDSGVVQGISGFGDFLGRITSKMRLPDFLRDLKAGLKFVLHTGQLVNNGLCNEPGKYPLDAAYGRTLLEMIGNTANLPGGAADIVSAIVTQNSNLGAELVTNDVLSYALGVSRGFYVIRTDNTTANTPKDYMSGYIVKRFGNPNQVTIVLFELGKTKPYYNSYNGSAWSGWNTGLQDSDFARESADLNTAFNGIGAISMYNWSNTTLHTPHKEGITVYGNGFSIGFDIGNFKVQIAFAVGENRIFIRSLRDGGAFSTWVAK